MGYSGAGGKLIHEKNKKQKISWHCPFKQLRGQYNLRKIKIFCHWYFKVKIRFHSGLFLCLGCLYCNYNSAPFP
jgi:hypothetical protein